MGGGQGVIVLVLVTALLRGYRRKEVGHQLLSSGPLPVVIGTRMPVVIGTRMLLLYFTRMRIVNG